VAGQRFICNRPADGIAVLEEWGPQHLSSGMPILYTSQDSVLQIAAHTDVVEPGELYVICEEVRAQMDGELAVGRVIARPFAGEPGSFERTSGRRDWALEPPGDSYLLALGRAGVPVHGVGKIHDLFAGVGVDFTHPGATNAVALASTLELAGELDRGFVFVNLIETDQVYGHRKDVEGFAAALARIDGAVSELIGLLRPDDLLIVCADHGVDPDHPSRDHTREYAPLLAGTAEGIASGRGARHDGPLADVGASVLEHLAGAQEESLPGTSFLGARDA